MTDLITLNKVQTDQEGFIKDLIETKGGNLPEKVEDVLHIFEFTDWKAKAFKSLSDKLCRLEDQTEAYHSALRSGQNWGIAALYAQKRMGELTKDIPAEKNMRNTMKNGTVLQREIADGKKGDISGRTWKDAERIASHPEILDATIEAAKQHNDIPTKTSVLNRIRMESAKETAQKVQTKVADKIDKKRPKAIADYYDAVKIFKHAIELAVIAAERDKFDPAGKNFLVTKHNQIKEMMEKLEGLV